MRKSGIFSRFPASCLAQQLLQQGHAVFAEVTGLRCQILHGSHKKLTKISLCSHRANSFTPCDECTNASGCTVRIEICHNRPGVDCAGDQRERHCAKVTACSAPKQTFILLQLTTAFRPARRH
jgi:hypothetical protein